MTDVNQIADRLNESGEGSGRCIGCEADLPGGGLCERCEGKLRMIDRAIGSPDWAVEEGGEGGHPSQEGQGG